jgi:hypothetical protein
MRNAILIMGALFLIILTWRVCNPPTYEKVKPASATVPPKTNDDSALDAETAKILAEADKVIKDAEQAISYSELSIAAGKLESAEIKKQLSNFRIKKDEFKQLSWYQPKTAPLYTNANGIYLYFAIKGNTLGDLRLRMQYYADDWLFIKSATFLIDGVPYELYTGRFERDNEGGMIWEWYDQPVDNQSSEIIAALLKCKSAKIRYNGQQYYNDRKITSQQLAAIRSAHKLYADLR